MLSLIPEISDYVKSMFKYNLKPYLHYHNLAHTIAVVGNALEISNNYKLTDQEQFELQTAAWFHDTGHLVSDVKTHEQESVKLMIDFLLPKNLSPETLTNITSLIMATQMPPKPVSQIEKILCDADTYHVGTPLFMQLDQLVWEEVEERMQKKEEDRYSKSLRFLENHQFFTSYCLENLEAGKRRNIELLRTLSE